MARSAFENDIPAKIINRKYKALAGTSQGDLIQGHSLRIKEMILDGYLVKERILHKPTIESVLATHAVDHPGISQTIMNILSIEVWMLRAKTASAKAA